MSKSTNKPVRTMEAPVERAMVFICEKCGKRAGAKRASYELASKLKRLLKHEFDKGSTRIALTSCMDACPEDAIAVSVQPVGLSAAAPVFLEADVYDTEASSESLLKIVAQLH